MINSIVSASANSGVWGDSRSKLQHPMLPQRVLPPAYRQPHSTTQSQQATTVRKRGFAYNDASLTHFFNGFKVSWTYNWYSAPIDSTSHLSGTLNLSQTFVPMLWSVTSDLTSVWAANAQAARRGSPARL